MGKWSTLLTAAIAVGGLAVGVRAQEKASRAARPSSNPTDGVISDGFKTTALPAASAGAIFCASIVSGEFHGVMAATTPQGSCTVIDRYGPRAGVMSEPSVSHTAAK